MRNTLDRDFYAMGYLSPLPACQGVGHDTGTHLAVWTGAVPVLDGAMVLPQCPASSQVTANLLTIKDTLNYEDLTHNTHRRPTTHQRQKRADDHS